MSERCQDCGNYIPVGESCGCYAGSVPMAHTPAKNEQPMNKPASVRTLLQPIFKDAMDWGRSYGQRLNLSAIDVDIVSDGYAEKAEQAILAKLAEKIKLYQGPVKFAPEEIKRGNIGIRWVTEDYVCGRPTAHDVREYLIAENRIGECDCDECKKFYTHPPTTTELVEAANFLISLHEMEEKWKHDVKSGPYHGRMTPTECSVLYSKFTTEFPAAWIALRAAIEAHKGKV